MKKGLLNVSVLDLVMMVLFRLKKVVVWVCGVVFFGVCGGVCCWVGELEMVIDLV